MGWSGGGCFAGCLRRVDEANLHVLAGPAARQGLGANAHGACALTSPAQKLSPPASPGNHAASSRSPEAG